MATGEGEIMVQFEQVGKRYNYRQPHDSLRDALPRLAARLLRRQSAQDRCAPRKTWALHDVSFTVRRGEALGVMGHNGAGKSTILKLLAGVTAPTSGYVRVLGRSAALIELGAGFHPDLTGRENVYLNGSILGLKRADLSRKMESIVDFANLEKFIDVPVKFYSTGMYARLGFAVAAHVEPEILLIDEILSVGDYTFQQKCIRRMEEFRRSGVAILFVSHNLEAIANLCSSAILLRAGQVMLAGAPVDVIDAYQKMPFVRHQDDETPEIEGDRMLRPMQIIQTQLRDAQGNPTTSFQVGDAAILTIRLRAKREIDEPIVGIDLRNAATDVYGTTSAMLKASIGHVANGEEIAAAFHLRLHLGQGIYTVHAGVFSVNEDRAMDPWEPAATIEVLGAQTSWGIGNLGASIQLFKH